MNDRVNSNVPTVERRRRDKINNWIVQLSKAIPDCNIDYTKTGQVSSARTLWFAFHTGKDYKSTERNNPKG